MVDVAPLPETDAGLKSRVVPEGRPDADRLTESEKPLLVLNVTL
jgi:hypothetical protein